MSTKLGCVILLCSVCINYRNSLMYAGQESNYWEGGRAPCKMTGKGSFNSQQFDIKKNISNSNLLWHKMGMRINMQIYIHMYEC